SHQTVPLNEEVVDSEKNMYEVTVPASKKRHSLKRKEAPSSDSKYDVEEDVPDITPSASKKKSGGKKILQNVFVALCDNVSFHRVSFAQRWDHVYKRSFARWMLNALIGRPHALIPCDIS
ncbi:envelope-like protein, partial [Trifolium pratense]